MTRFLKREKRADRSCAGCMLYRDSCWASELNMPFCGTYSIYILVPRPPDGTRCRDLAGKIKIVGMDV